MSGPSRTMDLSDTEFAALDDLLLETPEPLEPLDAVMLDGYLCGVIVQPVLIDSAEWLVPVFDFDRRPLPDKVDAAWLEHLTALIMRRHAALHQSIVEDGWFDPLVLESSAPASDNLPLEEEEKEAAAARASNPISHALLPWVAGFQYATLCFPALADMADDAVTSALARLYRHLPAEEDEEKEIVATLDRICPLHTLDEALQDLVLAVTDLQELTCEHRYKVDTVKREAPKIGRNEFCPCGSGKKFKQCHGAG